VAGVPIAGLLSRGGHKPREQDSVAELWIQYPHARREALREMLWVVPVIALAAAGAWIGAGHGSPKQDPISGMLALADPVPLWLSVMGGSLLGMLVGGGVVWAIRIFGSLGFGKEAMGMGDVWLMAAVGACLGWIDAVLIFFVAPFIALYLTGVLWAWYGEAKRAMPYGPSLAAATLMLVVGESGFERLLGMIWQLDGPMVLP
jgi:leader peptidase (prepilin peptidase) / N-methyltransferase